MHRGDAITDTLAEEEKPPSWDEFLWPLTDYVWAVPVPCGNGDPAKASTSNLAASKPAVLVVEDDRETQVFMQLLLGRDYDVFLASSGDEVRCQLFSHPGNIRIVLMDLSLKGPEDGLMITRSLRSDDRFRALPIIAVTAYAERADRVKSLGAGCNDYLPKPFEPQELLSRMKQFL